MSEPNLIVKELGLLARSKYFYITLLVILLVLLTYAGWIFADIGRHSLRGYSCSFVSNKQILIGMLGVAVLCLLSVLSIGEAAQASRMERARNYKMAREATIRMIWAIIGLLIIGAGLFWHVFHWC